MRHNNRNKKSPVNGQLSGLDSGGSGVYCLLTDQPAEGSKAGGGAAEGPDCTVNGRGVYIW